MSQTHSRAKEIFFDALDAPPHERSAIVERACGADSELRARVEELLLAEQRADSMLDSTQGLWGSMKQAGDLQLGDRIGPYLLEEILGEGGFGVVLRASQEEPVQRQVALKIIKLGMDTKSVVARFELERQALALMQHPNIAQVYDAGATPAGRPFFVMELVQGAPITDYCAREELSLEQGLRLFVTCCRAVHHAHQRGVLHRDLKPSNVLVVTVDGSPDPKVIDFGIAKATAQENEDSSFATIEGHLLGTPSYMSPEQAAGALDIDTRADVYSLGVVLYELLCGAVPFDTRSRSLPEVLGAIREQDPPRPSTKRREVQAKAEEESTSLQLAEIPVELEWIVLRCLEKERDRRYASAEDLARDVLRFLDHEPLEAAPPSLGYRLRKLVRRHRTAALAVVGIGLALLVGFIGTSIGLVRAGRLNEELDATVFELQETNTELDEALADARRANRELDAALEEKDRANSNLDLALGEARRQAAIAELVNDFLTQDLLGGARPTGAPDHGPQTPIVVLLDRAADELERATGSQGRFAGEPLLEASLRLVIANTYETLGLFARGQAHARTAWELRRDELGEDAHLSLAALSYLAYLERKVGEFELAGEHQERALAGLRQRFGLTHTDTLLAVARVVALWRTQGRGAEAQTLLTEALEASAPVLGEEDHSILALREVEAMLLSDAGRPEDALVLFEQVATSYEELLSARSPKTLNARGQVATVLRQLERYEEAEAVYRSIHELQLEIEGPGHPNVLVAQFNLVELLRSTERSDEAIELIEAHLDAVEAAYGPAHPYTLDWWGSLAQAQREVGNADACLEAWQEANDRSREHHGAEHELSVNTGARLGLAFELAGDRETAYAILADLYEELHAARDWNDPLTLEAEHHLAFFHLRGNELNEAWHHFQLLDQGTREVLPADSQRRLQAAAGTAILCGLQAQDERARELLLESAALAHSPDPTDQLTWRSGARQLANVYEFQGKAELAEHWIAVSEGRAEPEELGD